MASKIKEAKVFTFEDLSKFETNELFGLYCMVKTDAIPYPEREDFARIYEDFHNFNRKEIIWFLVNEKINKESY